MVTLAGHGDVIRCMALWEDKKSDCEWKRLAMTGSYDHSIRVWNVQDIDKADNKGKENRCISILSHGAPMEAVCLMKSDDRDVPVWLLSAGGTVIKVWNPITGHCQATITTQHRKTHYKFVTCHPFRLPGRWSHDETSLLADHDMKS